MNLFRKIPDFGPYYDVEPMLSPETPQQQPIRLPGFRICICCGQPIQVVSWRRDPNVCAFCLLLPDNADECDVLPSVAETGKHEPMPDADKVILTESRWQSRIPKELVDL
jgi:hypothetical protein